MADPVPTWEETIPESEALVNATTAPLEQTLRLMTLGSIASGEGRAIRQEREARKAALRNAFEQEQLAQQEAEARRLRYSPRTREGFVPTAEELQGASAIAGAELTQAGKDVRRSLEAGSLLVSGLYKPRGTLADVAKQFSVPRGATPEQLAEYPYQQGLAQLPEALQMAAEVPGGIAEVAPRIAGVAGMQAIGIPAPVGGALMFGLTEEGFNPQEAAVGAAIPYVGKYGGELARTLSKSLGISSKAGQNLVAAIGHGGGATAYLGTITASEIAGMAPEDRLAAVKKALPGSIGMLLMTMPGMKAELERGTPQQLAKLLNDARLQAGYRPRVPDRRLGMRMQPMDQPFADPEVQALADEALRQRMSGLVIPEQASAAGKLRRQLEQQVVPAPGGRALAERARAPGETLVRPTIEGLRVEPGFERTASDLLLEREKPEPMNQAERQTLQNFVDEEAKAGGVIPQKVLPKGVSYRQPTEAPTQAEYQRRVERDNVEAGMTIREVEQAPEPVTPPEKAPEGASIVTKSDRPKPFVKPTVLSALQRSRLRIALARGASEEVLVNIMRMSDRDIARRNPPTTDEEFRAARRQTEKAAKEKPKAETKPEPPKTMSDYERYQAARTQLRDMRERMGMDAFRSPEYMAIVGEMERIKNRNGGMPPTKPSPVSEGKAEPKPVPPAAPAGEVQAEPGAVAAAPVGQAISEPTAGAETVQVPIKGAAPVSTSRTIVPQGITAVAAGVRRQALQEFPHLRGLVENGEIVFTDGKEMWPDNVKADSRAESFEAVYLTNTGQVVFDARMFTGENAAKLGEIVVHEVAIHKGLRAALGDEVFNRTTLEIWDNLSPEQKAKLLRDTGMGEPGTETFRQIAGEEWLASEAQRVAKSGVTTTLWTQIADGFRKALRAIGFKRSLSDTEIAMMISKGWEGIKAREKAGRFEVPEHEKQGPSMEDGTVPQRYSVSSAKIKYYEDYVGKWTQDEQRVLGFLPQLANLDSKFWNWVQKTEKSTVRNIAAWNKFLDSHPQELSQMQALARFPEFADMLHPNGKLRATPMELREGGALNFHRNLPQMFLDRINPDTWMSIQNKMVEGVEHAYQLKRSQGTLPMKIIGLSNEAGLQQIAAESKEYRIQTPIRTAEKTVAAVNLNSACPEWVVGNRGCWVDACYLSQMARGNGVNLFERAMYTGEILQLSEAAAKELREVGLRVNGVGDTIATNVKPMQDIIRHARMRDIPIKIITKQEMSFKAVQDAASKGQDVSHVVVQPSIDYWWRKVADDMADKGAGAREIAGGDKERIAKLLSRRDPQAEAVLKEIYGKFGKEVKLINGQWYRKDGFTWDQVNAFKQKYPDVKILPRMVVGGTAEIMDAAMNHPDAVITFLHGKMDPSIVSEFAGTIHNYGAARHWFYWDPVAKKAVIRGEKNSPEFWGMRKGLITKEGYTALEQEINKLPLSQRKKVFDNLERQTCCQENDSPDACADCAAHCALRTIYSAEDIKANQVGPLNKPGANGTPEARMGVPELTSRGLVESEGETIPIGAEPGFRAAMVRQEDVGTKEFNKWFKGSKVVDENKQPLLMYHGGPVRVESMDPTKLGEHGQAVGMFFTSSPDVAGFYGKETNPAYVVLKNPAPWEYVVQARKYSPTFRQFVGALKNHGYDGYMYRAWDAIQTKQPPPGTETPLNVVVLDDNQIKFVEQVRGEEPGFRAAKTLADARKIFEEKPKPKQPVRLVGRVRTGFFSQFHPTDELVKMVADAYGYTKPKQIAHLFEQLKGSRGKGEAEVYRFDRDVGPFVKGQEKNFNVYMFAQRTIDRLLQDARQGIARRKVSDWTIADAQQVLRELEREVGFDTFDKFKKASAKYQTYMDRALLLQVESGRMSRQQYNLIKSQNQFYAPFKVMKHMELQEMPEGTGQKVDTMADYTKAMEGIEDPDLRLGDMMAAARQALITSRIMADKAVAMRNISDIAAMDTRGLFARKMFKGQKPREGFSPVNVYENGKVFKYEVPTFVAQALQTLGPASNGPYVKWLSLAALPFRVGATAFNVPFQGSNLVADVPRAALVSKYGIRAVTDAYRYPWEFIESIFSSIGANVFGYRNKLYFDFLESGAAGSSVQEFLMPKALLGEKKSLPKKVFANTIGKLGDFAQALEQTSKILGVKRAIRFEKVKSGAELAKLVPEAITEIRRFSGSPDFGRQGKWTQQARLNFVLMFLNARVQGAGADIGRLVGMDGKKTAAITWARLITAVGLPTVLLYLFNNSSDDLREGYKQRSDFEKRNYWLIPKDTFITTEDGERIRDYWRIPKRESAKWVANLAESALEFAEKKDPEAFKEFTVTMLEDVSPVNIGGDTAQERLESVGASLNPIFKTPLELATGKDMYRHQMIVPEIMRGAGTPELQFKERTPELFKWAANMLPDMAPSVVRSPLMLENITKNLTAGLITQWLPKKPIEGRGPIENFPLFQRFQAMPYIDTEQKQKLIDELKGEAVDNYLIRHRKAQKYMEDNKGSDLETIMGKVYESGDLQDVKLANHLVDLWIAKENGVNAVERRLIALPAEQRAKFVLKALSEKTGAEQEKLYIDWVRKRVLTEATLIEMMKQDPEGKFLPIGPGIPKEATPMEVPSWEDTQPVK